MRSSLVLSMLSFGLCIATELPGQAARHPVTSVRVSIQKVDQVALDFGVDSAALREQAVRRLSAAGIVVKQDSDVPELVISVRVPRKLAPVDDGILIVETLLLEPASASNRRTLWRAVDIGRRFTRFGSLPELVPAELDRNLEALASARPTT